MFADPNGLIVTFATGLTDAVAYGAGYTFVNAPATGRSPTSSTYRYAYSSTNFIDVFIGHQEGKRNRYTVRLTETELVPDPVDSTKNVQKTTTYYVVCDRSHLGDATHARTMTNTLASWLMKTNDGSPKFDRVLAGET